MIDELPLANNIFSPKDRKSGEHVAEINVFIYYEIGEEGEEGREEEKRNLIQDELPLEGLRPDAEVLALQIKKNLLSSPASSVGYCDTFFCDLS